MSEDYYTQTRNHRNQICYLPNDIGERYEKLEQENQRLKNALDSCIQELSENNDSGFSDRELEELHKIVKLKRTKG